MATILEKAMFIGRDGSCGLRKGKVYDVKLCISFGEISANDIPYDTISAVQKNWDFRKPFTASGKD